LVDAAVGSGVLDQASVPVDREAALGRIREIQARFPGSINTTQVHRTREEIQAELDTFARLRSRFKGPPIPTEELVAAIERDSHPPDFDHFASAEPTSQ